MFRRTSKFRGYPTPRSGALLFGQLSFTRELYNALLKQRIVAYKDGMPRFSGFTSDWSRAVAH